MQSRFLSIDLGTQGTKAALLDDEATPLAEAFAPAVFCGGRPGVIEQDADLLYAHVLELIQRVLLQSGVSARQVVAIGVVGQMAGIVGIEEDFRAVTPYDSGLDKRCAVTVAEMTQRYEKRIIELSGCPVIVAQGAKMCWWKDHEPEAYRRIRKMVPLSTYICGRLAGLSVEEAYIDTTHIHLTHMADNEHACWSDELIGMLGFDREKLPRIVEPFEVIGFATAAVARKTGLLAGTPVVAGCGDTAASGLGAGLVDGDTILDIAGTASVLAGFVSEYKPDVEEKALLFQRSILPGRWMPFGFVLGGQTLDWYRDQLSWKERLSFAELDRGAASVRTDGLYFIPYFAGKICPSNPRFSGHWIGLKFYHTREHMYRSIMEAVAYEYRYYLERIRKLLPQANPQRVIASGGGAKSEVFAQIKADVIGLPIVPLKQRDTSHKAAALIAGHGVGYYPELPETARHMTQSERESPVSADSQRTENYIRRYEVYAKAVRHMERLHDMVEL